MALGSIEHLNSSIALERLVVGWGIELVARGDELRGACVWCGGVEALVVRPGENTWACKPCGKGGGVVDWVMAVKGVSQKHAVELLRADVLGEEAGRVVRKATVPKLPSDIDPDAQPETIVGQVFRYYHECLLQNPEALGYLQKRGITDPEALAQFQIGFCNRTLGYRIPAKNRRAGKAIRDVLAEAGVLRASGHEHFRGSVVFPVVDEAGYVVQAYGRKINHNLRRGTENHLWLPGERRGVWNLAAFQASSELVLCESLIDALTLWCAGYRHVTAVRGPVELGADVLAAFSGHNIERCLIAYDHDDEGDAGAVRVVEQLMAAGVECFRVVLPPGEDINSYGAANDWSSDALGALLRNAKWLGRGESGSEPAPVVESVVAAEPVTVLDVQDAQPSPPPEPSKSDVPAASPVPAAPPVSPKPEVKDHEVIMHFGDRRWRVRGLGKCMSYESLRVNVLVQLGEAFHVDTFDLYSAKHRASFVLNAKVETGCKEEVIKRDLGRLLLSLEELQDQQIQAAMSVEVSVYDMDDDERGEALAWLKDPGALDAVACRHVAVARTPKCQRVDACGGWSW